MKSAIIGFFSRAGASYARLNERHPKKLNMFMAFTIASGGDILCQYFLFKYMPSMRPKDSIDRVLISDPRQTGDSHVLVADTKEIQHFKWDKNRTLDMALVRSILVAPWLYFWYQSLSKYVTIPGKYRNLFLRLFIDTLFGGPIVISLVFFGNDLLIHGIKDFSFSGYLERLAKKGPSTWLTGLTFNPFVVAINFAFVPLRHQPLYAHFTSILWTAVLSYYSNMDVRVVKTITPQDDRLDEAVDKGRKQ